MDHEAADASQIHACTGVAPRVSLATTYQPEDPEATRERADEMVLSGRVGR
jgi:hypothetical protein